MPAYVIVETDVRDAEAYERYKAAASEAVAAADDGENSTTSDTRARGTGTRRSTASSFASREAGSACMPGSTTCFKAVVNASVAGIQVRARSVPGPPT